MANNVLNWAWGIQLDPMEKLVLVALSDRSDERGYCYPGIAWLVRVTGASERTVQRAIRKLELLGHILRNQKPGKGCEYFLSIGKNANPRQPDTPVTGTPPSECREPPSEGHPTPVSLTPDPRQSDAQSLNYPSSNPHDPSLFQKAETGSKASGELQIAGKAAGLPPDWQPNLDAATLNLISAWPEGELQTALSDFRYHAADNGRLSKNWNAAFARWLVKRNQIAKDQRRIGGRAKRDNRDGMERYLARRIAAGNLSSGEWTKEQAEGYADGTWLPPDELDMLLSLPETIDGGIIEGRAIPMGPEVR